VVVKKLKFKAFYQREDDDEVAEISMK